MGVISSQSSDFWIDLHYLAIVVQFNEGLDFGRLIRAGHLRDNISSRFTD